MKIKLLLCLLVATAARAANYVGDQTFNAPLNVNEPINIVGNLTFSSPGTYAATNWNIVGYIRFAAPGNYTVLATAGGFTVSGSALGPTSGFATVHVGYTATVNFVGTVAANVSVIDDTDYPAAPPPSGTPPPPAPLMNLSARATLGPGGMITPGFFVGGTEPRRMLIRAVGPGLVPFGVTDVLANPTLTLFNGSLRVGSNDDWGGSSVLSSTFTTVGAFGLQAASRDAALLIRLPPGAYTVSVRGAGANDAGEVLVEVYYVD